MLKVLLKKQFLELGKSYFRSKKMGQKSSKFSTIGFSILFAFLYLSLCMAFAGMAYFLYEPLKMLDKLWLYFSLYFIICTVMATFIVMFYTSSYLYNAKDNELLLSLPIKSIDIVLSRIIVLYVNALIYTSIVWLPITIVFLFQEGFSLTILISNILMWLAIALIALVLSCVFGYIVELISSKFKNKNIVSTLMTILMLVAYYYFYFNINQYLNKLVENIFLIENYIVNKMYPFYIVGISSLGDIKSLLLVLIVAVLLTTLCVYLINKNFIKIITKSNSSGKRKYNANNIKQKTSINALESKELQHYLSNTTYTMNCGLGILFLLAMAACLVIFKKDIFTQIDILSQVLPVDKLLPVILLALTSGIVGMDALSTPAVSLEGNTYWIVRSLPISSYEVLSSKRQVQFKMNVVPALIFVITSTFIFNISGNNQILLVLSTIFITSFISHWDLFLGIKGASLNWTSEVVPIKQSLNVMIAVFSSFGIMFIVGGVYYLLLDKINTEIYFVVLILIFSLGTYILDRWVKTKGVKEFESLS